MAINPLVYLSWQNGLTDNQLAQLVCDFHDHSNVSCEFCVRVGPINVQLKSLVLVAKNLLPLTL